MATSQDCQQDWPKLIDVQFKSMLNGRVKEAIFVILDLAAIQDD